MTIYVPLDHSQPCPSTPSFLHRSPEPVAQLARVTKAIRKARRIIVVCGAGISVQAGIPDFRSSNGLFQTLKRDNPKEALTSGKDLFDASVFSSESTTSIFCQMMAQLSEMSQVAEPTPFHRLLAALDRQGKLLRVYTQNIDALEAKTGLSLGVPDFDDRRSSYKGKGKAPAGQLQMPVASAAEIPRCIPLHGTLERLHCLTCNHSAPTTSHLPNLAAGALPPCPECTALEATRAVVGKRARGVGRLRPSVVLYNEVHKDGEGVGAVVRRDLLRAGADLLLVVGTSLRVGGTKRIVREFSKAVRCPRAPGGSLPTPASSPRPGEEPPVRAVYLNLDFPVPTREWEGVFDVWVHGDAQAFAGAIQGELDREEQAKAAARERKAQREAAAVRASATAKRKTGSDTALKPAKRRKLSGAIPPPRTKPIVGSTRPSAPSATTIRIPARKPRTAPLRRRLSLPEVVITSVVVRHPIKPPLTPTPSPPASERADGHDTPAHPDSGALDDSSGDESGYDARPLPQALVRMLQTGLRSAG